MFQRRKALPMNEQLRTERDGEAVDLAADVERLTVALANLAEWVEDVRPWVDAQVGDWRFNVKRRKRDAQMLSDRMTAALKAQHEEATTERVLNMADTIPLDGSMKIRTQP